MVFGLEYQLRCARGTSLLEALMLQGSNLRAPLVITPASGINFQLFQEDAAKSGQTAEQNWTQVYRSL